MKNKINTSKLGKPHPETGLRAEGWSREKIKEMVSIFEKLDYELIGKILDSTGIHFCVDYRTISKKEIVYTIADDWSPENLKEIIKEVS